MSDVSKCPLCNSFAAKSFKGVLRHMGTVHAHDPAFFVRCAAGNCHRTYRNYHSYRIHLYKKHRDVLDESLSLSSGDAVPIPSVSQSMTTPVSPCDPEFGNGEANLLTTRDTKKEAALFVLKSKHI